MNNTASPRITGLLAAVGGLVLTVLGAVTVVAVDALGRAWFATAGVAILLVVTGLLGLRTVVADLRVARRALTVATVLMTLFGLAHFYALVDEDRAVVAFSVFMVLASLALTVAGVSIVRSSRRRRPLAWIPLVCGVWPVLTIPAGGAIGDVPHFAAIAAWGALWVAFGLALRSGGIVEPAPRSELTSNSPAVVASPASSS